LAAPPVLVTCITSLGTGSKRHPFWLISCLFLISFLFLGTSRGHRNLYHPCVTNQEAECVFCRIASGAERSWKVYENADSIAILDRFPAVPGHTLVMPRRHAADIWDIGREDAGRLMEAVHDVAALLGERLSPDGMTLFQANRNAGWQTVLHMHFHVVPRQMGDPLTVAWTPQAASEAELNEILNRIR
jgi:histidine triad (HIT) family protein